MAEPFKLSELTSRLVAFLKMHDKGYRLTYAEISKNVGERVKENSPRLAYARRVLERDHQQIWVAVRPRIGLRRLTDPEIAERLRGWWLPGAKRKLIRGGNQSSKVEINQLDIDEQARFSVDSIQRELALQSLSKSTWRHLEKVARGTSNDLPVFNALEWAIALSPRIKKPPVAS